MCCMCFMYYVLYVIVVNVCLFCFNVLLCCVCCDCCVIDVLYCLYSCVFTMCYLNVCFVWAFSVWRVFCAWLCLPLCLCVSNFVVFGVLCMWPVCV